MVLLKYTPGRYRPAVDASRRKFSPQFVSHGLVRTLFATSTTLSGATTEVVPRAWSLLPALNPWQPNDGVVVKNLMEHRPRQGKTLVGVTFVLHSCVR
jgi:hypothetical protein